MTEQKAAPPKVQLVCVGKAHAKRTVCLVFRLVASDGTAGEERVYSRKNLKQIRVGSVYEVETDAEDSTRIVSNTIRWVRTWKDKGEAAIWQTAAAAFDTLELARKSEKREAGRRLPLEVLQPLRDEYRRTNSAGKLALEVRVLAYLRMASLGGDE